MRSLATMVAKIIKKPFVFFFRFSFQSGRVKKVGKTTYATICKRCLNNFYNFDKIEVTADKRLAQDTIEQDFASYTC